MPRAWLGTARVRRVASVLAILAMLPTIVFGLRTYGSFVLLRSATAAGAPATSAIRPWMTLGYVAATYHRPEAALLAALGLPQTTAAEVSLKSLADTRGMSRPDYVQRVQRAIGGSASMATAQQIADQPSWLGALADDALAALLLYGYPALGLMLLAGAVGLPLPDGVATALAGSLIASGRMSWLWAGAVASLASLLGDVIGYVVGRWLSRELLDRYGGWIGYTRARHARVGLLFRRYGVLTVLLTRTFVSYLSSVTSLLAGASRYRPVEFVSVALLGRLLWTLAYLGIGYAIGADFEAAASLLTNASGLLVSLSLLGASVLVAVSDAKPVAGQAAD
jgi:membrane-associated protein